MRWSVKLFLLVALMVGFVVFLIAIVVPSMKALFISNGTKTASFLGGEKVNYKKSTDAKTYVGVIRSTGLSEVTKEEFNLPNANYQITDLAQSTEKYIVQDTRSLGYVLAFEGDTQERQMTKYLGRCTRLEAYEMQELTDDMKSQLGGRLVLVPKSITETSYQSCSPYPEMISLTASQKKKKFTVHGVVENQIRPSIDTTYDYRIKFVPPFQGAYNAAAETGSFSEMVLIPGTSAAWQQIEENIGKNAEIVAYLRWGDDAVRYLLVESVK